MDLSKALDSLPHGLLIAKIHACRVDLPSCKLIASNLYNRHQRVKIRDKRSGWLKVERDQYSVPSYLTYLSMIYSSLHILAVYTIMLMTTLFYMLAHLLNKFDMY